MLFLLRPRQTRMPYGLPRDPVQQDAHNQQLREAYASTRRVAVHTPTTPGVSPRNAVADLNDLAQLHRSGALTDAEFATAKARVLEAKDDPA